YEDHGDRPELAPEVGQGTLLDGARDLPHGRRPRIGGEHAAHQEEAHEDGEKGRGCRENQPGPLPAGELERLVPPFSREGVDHADCSLLSRSRGATSWRT